MLTRCPTSAELEVFVLDPECKDQVRINAHIGSCPYCQVSIAELRREWLELAETSKLTDSLSFELLPTSDVSTAIGITSLAAKGPIPQVTARGLTLASSDKAMWLKAVRDAQTDEVWLYLFSDDESIIPRNAVVRPFGLEREFIADDQGRINLGRIQWPERESLRAEVRLPTAAFRLEEIGDLDRPAGEASLTSPSGDRLHVSWTADERGRRITIEVQSLAGFSPETPLQVAIRARDLDSPVQIRTSQLDQPLTVEQPGSLKHIEIFVYRQM
jgi:hypothetical protein